MANLPAAAPEESEVGEGPAIRGICRGVGALAGVANEVVELQRLDPPPQTPPRVPRHRYLQKQRVRACVSVRVRVRVRAYREREGERKKW